MKVSCAKGVCKRCGSNEVSAIGLIECEIYCRCAKCGRLRVSCCDFSLENKCNDELEED